MAKQELTCSCCGGGFRGEWDPSDEVGHGYCPACKRWFRGVFFGTRIKVLRENLSPKNREKLDKMPRWKQENVVARLIERGAMI